MSEEPKFLVIDWEDGGCSVTEANKVATPEGSQIGKDVLKTVKNKLWRGKIESTWGNRAKAKLRYNELCPKTDMFLTETGDQKRKPKPTAILRALENLDDDDHEDESSVNVIEKVMLIKENQAPTKSNKPTKKPKKKANLQKALTERKESLKCLEILQSVRQVKNPFVEDDKITVSDTTESIKMSCQTTQLEPTHISVPINDDLNLQASITSVPINMYVPINDDSNIKLQAFGPKHTDFQIHKPISYKPLDTNINNQHGWPMSAPLLDISNNTPNNIIEHSTPLARGITYSMLLDDTTSPVQPVTINNLPQASCTSCMILKAQLKDIKEKYEALEKEKNDQQHEGGARGIPVHYIRSLKGLLGFLEEKPPSEDDSANCQSYTAKSSSTNEETRDIGMGIEIPVDTLRFAHHEAAGDPGKLFNALLDKVFGREMLATHNAYRKGGQGRDKFLPATVLDALFAYTHDFAMKNNRKGDGDKVKLKRALSQKLQSEGEAYKKQLKVKT